jgi:hypothetical protein
MNVIPITLAISLCLTLTFILFFWREQMRHGFSSAERDSLLPLGEETPGAVSTAQGHNAAPLVLELKGIKPRHVRGACGRAAGHSHDADHPPCAGCAHRAAHGHDHA